MTTPAEHDRRPRTPAKRKALIALLLCAAASTGFDATAEVRSNPHATVGTSAPTSSAATNQTALPSRFENAALANSDRRVPTYALSTAPRQQAVTGKVVRRPQRLPAVAKESSPKSTNVVIAAPAPPVVKPVSQLPGSKPIPDAVLATQPHVSVQQETAQPIIKNSSASDRTTTVRRQWQPTPVATQKTLPLRTVTQNPRPTTHQRGSISWLQSSTASSQRKESIRLLDQANREYEVRAYASAEASAWASLRKAAEGIDIAERTNRHASQRSNADAATHLQIARDAIREANDFAGAYGDLNAQGVRRIVRSHRTNVLKRESSGVPATDAVDRYFNEARIHLSQLAAARVEAAQAMDLLAAIHLGRNETQSLPSQTALCLRRAALQGQPGNGSLALRLGMQLADLGLDAEAKWALEHSLTIEPTREASESLALVVHRLGDRAAAARLVSNARNQFPAQATSRTRIPEIVQMSPQEFASVSPSVMSATSSARNDSANVGVPQAAGQATIRPTSYQLEAAPQTVAPGAIEDGQSSEAKPKSTGVKRFLGPLGRLW